MKKFNYKDVIVITFFLLSVSLCAQNFDSKKIAKFFGFHANENLTLLGVKAYQQTEEYTCGPAIVMSLMNYYGMMSTTQMNKSTELRIAKEMGTSVTEGTSEKQMVDWLGKNGFTVKHGENGTISMLRNNLKNNIPVIVEWIDWGGHWVIVSGYNKKGKTPEENQDTLFLADPSIDYDNVKTIEGITTFNAYRFFNMWFYVDPLKPKHFVKGLYIIAVPKG